MPRTLNSAKNMASSLGISLIMILLGFVTRKVFVDNVGVEYLGLNGLLQNILGIMTLLEGGFATSVVYNLYKPLADDDRPKIVALLQLYRKVYRYIALGIVAFALLLYPFLDIFLKDAKNLEYVTVVYFIFVFNSVIGYLAAYKWSIINASQQTYRLTAINLTYQVGLNLAKLAILYYTKNYILYLVVEALFGVGLNIAFVRKANALFPYIRTKTKYMVEDGVKKNIVSNMKALFINKIGGYFMHSTDNIVISTFVGVGVVGLYSNYTLLTGTITSLANQVLNSFSESVGNLIASETKDKVYEVFRTVFFVNFLTASIPIILMFNTLNPFVRWWLGPEYVLGRATVYIIFLNFYIDIMRSSALTFKVKAGIFRADRWTPFMQGVLNVVLSLWFVHMWGITGVLLATGLSILSIGFWQFPRLCYKHIFKRPLWAYFRAYLCYTAVGAVALALSCGLCSLTPAADGLLEVLQNFFITGVVTAAVYYAFFRRTEPYRQLLVYVRAIVPGFKK